MLRKYSKSCQKLINLVRKPLTTKIANFHSQITKQLGFTQTFQKAVLDKLKRKQKNSFLRLQIFAGQGCQGFTYKFKFDNQLKDNDFVYKLKTQQPEEKKVVFATNGEEMKMLKGATIDYAEEMMREIFYVKQNPNAEISCSCKTSFSPKNYVF